MGRGMTAKKAKGKNKRITLTQAQAQAQADELKRLLKGDRDSYDRGYKDGYDAAIAKIMEALESDTF